LIEYGYTTDSSCIVCAVGSMIFSLGLNPRTLHLDQRLPRQLGQGNNLSQNLIWKKVRVTIYSAGTTIIQIEATLSCTEASLTSIG
jgi:hypothetical protein